MAAAGTLFEHFEALTDPRVNRGNNHSLYDMVVIALTAAIAMPIALMPGHCFWKAKSLGNFAK